MIALVQLVGLIVAAYAMFRMIQLPLSMAAFEGSTFLGLKPKSRLVLVSVLAGVTFCVLGLLAVSLLFVVPQMPTP